MSTTYDWDFISSHLDDIIWPILYKSRKDNLQSLFADDYYLDDVCYRIACEALKKKLGIEIISVSFKVVTREELLSVRHKESALHKSFKSNLVDIDSVFEYFERDTHTHKISLQRLVCFFYFFGRNIYAMRV